MEMSRAPVSMDIRMVPEFDGSSLSAAEWLRKAESACQLCGISDVVRVIGLRLTGAAFAVYDQMAPEDQIKLEKVKEKLLAAFAPNPFMAFREFKVRKLRRGETPDAFLAGLRELALLAGGVSDKVLASAFIDGLPEQVQESMRSGARMETLSLDELLTRARAMLANGPVGYNGLSDFAAATNTSASVALSSGSHYRCYACGGINHFAKECPTRRQEAEWPMRAGRKKEWPHRRNSGRDLKKATGPTESGNMDRGEALAPAPSRY
ncbi:hypothetical protein M513_10102 [Trichuris suis]|uniref:CCHC-type domain-containing protein n=1 Tax=Trichuris suis TaxID=68888 RepID=A0A085LVQ8_9BILA|nr:hypothetical protein M513_10102 [Trichuris suis]